MGRTRIAAMVLAFCGFAAAGAAVAQDGHIAGRVTRTDGRPLGGVLVKAVEAARSTLTNGAGDFGLDVPAGTYRLVLSGAGQEDVVAGVVVEPALPTRVDRTLDWTLSPREQAVASVASGHRERASDAPGAVTVVAADKIALSPPTALPPTLVARVPGVDLAQSGLHDFDLNARGLNHSLARRVAVRIDGRDPSLPFFGGQDWAAFPLPASAFAQAEIERGPASALYGRDATGGVLNLVTKGADDRAHLLGSATGGDLSTRAADLSLGDRFGPWGVMVLGDFRKSDDFAVSRNGQAEYSQPCAAAGQGDCLPQEAVALPRADQQVWSTSARVDRGFADGSAFRLSGGYTQERGPILATDIGRLQIVDADRKWAAGSFATGHYDVHGSYNGRAAGQQVDLATGENLALDSRNFQGDLSTYWDFLSDRLHLLGGAWYEDEQSDSVDRTGPIRRTQLLPNNRETLLFQAIRAGSEAGYGQVEWDATPRLRLLAGGRYDSSDLYSSQFSPRLGLVYALSPGQTLRLTANRGFQAPTVADLYLQNDVMAPAQLGSLENICTLEGVPCGFDLHFRPGNGPDAIPSSDTRILAVGNRALRPEHVTSVEGGYSGTLGSSFLVTVDAHWAHHEDVISDFVPQVGTSLGRINPAFTAYVPSKFLSPAAQAQLLAGLHSLLGPLFPFLTTKVDGTPILVLSSKTNGGDMDAYGADLGLRWHPASGWTAGLTYSFLDTSVKHAVSDLPDLLSANTPRNQGNASLGYSAGRFDAMLAYRYADSFRWVSGPFRGDVPSYGIADLAARVRIDRHFSLGLDVENLFDKRHYETFGGDLLRRRILGSLSLGW